MSQEIMPFNAFIFKFGTIIDCLGDFCAYNTKL